MVAELIIIMLTIATFISLVIGLLVFAMIMVKPVNKIFDWFDRKGWFD